MVSQAGYCAHCATTATMTCFKCHSVNYCSVECLEADDRIHKNLCKQVAEFKTIPNNHTRRGILLPEKSLEPQFVWLERKGFTDPDFDFLENKGVSQNLQGIYPSPVVAREFGSGKHLDHSIFAAYRDSFLNDGSKTNECIEHLTQGASRKDWRGPLLLFGQEQDIAEGESRDLDASDVTIGLDGILTMWGKESFVKKTRGVRVNPTPPYFEAVSVPLQHPMFSIGAQSAMSKKIYIPVRTYLYNGTTSSKAGAPNDKPSVPAAYLHTIIDEDDSYFTSPTDIGKVPQGWINNHHSMLVILESDEDIALKHVIKDKEAGLNVKLAKILCTFARYESEAMQAANTSAYALEEYMNKNLTKEMSWGLVIKMTQDFKKMKEADIVSEFGSMTLAKYQSAEF